MDVVASNAALPERCEKKRSDDRVCGRAVTRVRVTRSDDGRSVVELHGYCEAHGASQRVHQHLSWAIPVGEYCKAAGHKPIKPGDTQATVLALFDRSWSWLRGGAGVGRTAAALCRRGLLECDRGHTRAGRTSVMYRLTEEGVTARSLLSARHVYYGPGSHVFNTPAVPWPVAS